MQKISNLDSLKELYSNHKTIFIVTGISGSGKTTLSRRLSEYLQCPLLSFDDYKLKLYERYGFRTDQERKRLWEQAKRLYQVDILRMTGNLIIEYPFDTSWQKFFDLFSNDFGYTVVCVYCNSREFEDIWQARVQRDSDILQRPRCLTASAYVCGELYVSNGKLNAQYKEKKRLQYLNDKYTSIVGDYVITDAALSQILNELEL